MCVLYCVIICADVAHLRSTKAPECSVRALVSPAHLPSDPHVGYLVHTVTVQQCPVHDGVAQVPTVTCIVEQLAVCSNDTTLLGETHLVLTQEGVALTCRVHTYIRVHALMTVIFTHGLILTHDDVGTGPTTQSSDTIKRDLQVYVQVMFTGRTIHKYIHKSGQVLTLTRHLHVLITVQCNPDRPLQVVSRHSCCTVQEDATCLLTTKATSQPLGLTHHPMCWHTQNMCYILLVLSRGLGT